MRKTSLLILILFPISQFCQLTDYIYCLNNAAIGEFNIAKIHLPTGEMTEFETVSNTVSTMNSACVDVETGKFYFCDGYSIKVFNTYTEALEDPIILPVSGNTTFHQIQYNPCDDSFYGVMSHDNFNSFSFERFDTNTSQFEVISVLPSNYFSCGDCISALDPTNNVFVSDHGGISGLDLSSGEEIIDTAPVSPNGFAFGHMSYKCTTQEFFGTMANLDQETKQLGMADPMTGLVSSVSDANWTVGFWKPYGGGNVIDQGTEIYYYSGAGGLLIGASTITGELVYSEDVSAGEIFFLQHFSQCACPTITGITEVADPDLGIQTYPNPVTDVMNIRTDNQSSLSYSIRDLVGKKLLEGQFISQLDLDLHALDQGTYYCEFKDSEGMTETVKILKE